jgi:hypothetical protein
VKESSPRHSGQAKFWYAYGAWEPMCESAQAAGPFDLPATAGKLSSDPQLPLFVTNFLLTFNYSVVLYRRSNNSTPRSSPVVAPPGKSFNSSRYEFLEADVWRSHFVAPSQHSQQQAAAPLPVNPLDCILANPDFVTPLVCILTNTGQGGPFLSIRAGC